MTTNQWVGVILFVVFFFGSFALGRYLRCQDEKNTKPPPVCPPNKTISVNLVNHGNGDTGLIYSSEDSKELMEFMREYYTEVERLARGYHGTVILQGEKAAEAWLRKQTGQK